MQQIPISLTRAQVERLIDGKAITVKSSQFNQDSASYIMLHDELANKIIASHEKGRSCRFTMTADELVASKSGLGGVVEDIVLTAVRTFKTDKLDTFRRLEVEGLKDVLGL